MSTNTNAKRSQEHAASEQALPAKRIRHDQPSDGTVVLPWLSKFSLVINTIHQVLICTLCRCIVDPEPSSFQQHLKGHKFSFPSRSFQEQFQQEVISKYPHLTFHPQHPRPPTLSVYGLPQPEDDYHACTSCHHAFKSSAKNKHRCPNSSQPQFIACKAQRFKANTFFPWFPVQVNKEPIAAPPATLWNVLDSQLKAVQAEEARVAKEGMLPDNWRVLRTFLHKQDWLQRVEGKDVQKLHELAAFSTRHPQYGSLARHLHSFLGRTQGRSHDQFLRRLVGQRPRSEHAEVFVRHHSDVHYNTHKKYSLVIAAAIQLVIQNCLEPSGVYHFQLSAAVQDACHHLIHALSNKEADPIVEPEAECDADQQSEDGDYGSDDEENQRISYSCDPPSEPTELDPYMGENRTLPHSPIHIQKALVTLLEVLYQERPARSNPFVHYLVISSVKPNGGWLKGSEISQKIAALLFTARSLLMHLTIENKKAANPGYNEAFIPYRSLVSEEGEGVIPHLYIVLRQLEHVRSAEDSVVHFNAPDNSGQSAFMGKEILDLAQIGKALDSLQQDITEGIDELVLGNPLFTLEESQHIYDEPKSTEPLYSFVDDTRNIWHTRPPLLQHICDNLDLLHQFGSPAPDNSAVLWNPEHCIDWMRRVFEVQRLFIIALLLSSGQPPRATEFASNLLRNVPQGSIRNTFVLFNVFLVRGSFNKTSSMTSQDKTMVRVPLIPIGRQFIRFLAYVRPLYEYFQHLYMPELDQDTHHFLFMPFRQRITSPYVSNVLTQYMETQFRVHMRIRRFRQFMAFIASCNSDVFDLAQMVTTAVHEQLGHTGAVDRIHYAGDSRIPVGFDLSTFMRTARISGVFHLLLGHGPELFRLLECGNAKRAEIAAIIKAIRQPPAPTVLPSSQSAVVHQHSLDNIIDQLSQRLGTRLFAHVNDSLSKAHAAVVDLFLPQHVFPQPSPLPVCTHPYILKKLQEFMGQTDDACGFTNEEQAAVTQLMFERKRHVLYVAPTGSGKTMPGLLNAALLDGNRSTVWLLPLRSMHEQYHVRSAACQLTCETWSTLTSSEKPPKNVLATIELTQGNAFKDFLTKLQRTDRLARIIIDEAHLLITHEYFRPVMSTLKWLGTERVQIVMQTATLPPSLEQALIDKVGLTSYIACRAKTGRPNISFNVFRTEKGGKVEKDLLHKYFAQALGHSATSRLIVFCKSNDQAHQIAAQLNIPCCESRMPDDEILDVLAQFRSGEVRAVASTTLLGVGLDVPSVTHVIHLGYPFDMISFAQEVGRAGRDPTAPLAWSYVLLPHSPASNTRQKEDDRLGVHLMKDSLDSSTLCRRAAMQFYLDGRPELCTMIGGRTHLCDICRQQVSIAPSPEDNSSFPWSQIQHVTPLPLNPYQSTVQDPPNPSSSLTLSAAHAALHTPIQLHTQSKSDISLHKLHQALASLRVACVPCWLQEKDCDHFFQHSPQHRDDCSHASTWCTSLSFPPTFCKECALPRKLSYKDPMGKTIYFHLYDDGTPNPCSYRHILPLFAWTAMHHSHVADTIRRSSLNPERRPFKQWLFCLDKKPYPNIVDAFLLFVD